MSKELKAWNFIKDQMQNFTFSHLVTEMVKNSDIVEQALKRLVSIDKSQEEVGCTLEVINKTMQYGFYNEKTDRFYEPSEYEIKYAVDEDGLKYARLEVYELIMDSSIYNKLILVADVWTSDYKKTWWLKKDKSE